MSALKIPPKHLLYAQDVTAVILYLEKEVGLTQKQVIDWFRDEYNDYLVDCQLYYEKRNAGNPKPLQEKRTE